MGMLDACQRWKLTADQSLTWMEGWPGQASQPLINPYDGRKDLHLQDAGIWYTCLRWRKRSAREWATCIFRWGYILNTLLSEGNWSRSRKLREHTSRKWIPTDSYAGTRSMPICRCEFSLLLTSTRANYKDNGLLDEHTETRDWSAKGVNLFLSQRCILRAGNSPH